MPTPQGARSSLAKDGVVDGLTWDQLVNALTYTNGNSGLGPNGMGIQGGSGTLAQLGAAPVQAWRNGAQNYGGEGAGFSQLSYGDGPATYSYEQLLPDGTVNQFTQGDNGQVISKNITQNTDSWWDSTGYPIALALLGGGAAAGAAAAGVGVSAGAAAGAGAAGAGAAGTGLADAGAAAGTGAFDAAGSLGTGLVSGSIPSGAVAFEPALGGWVDATGSVVGGSGLGGAATALPGVTVTGAAGGGLGAGTAAALGGGAAAAGTGAALASGGGGNGTTTANTNQQSNPLSNLSNLKSGASLGSSIANLLGGGSGSSGGGGLANGGGPLTNPSVLNGLLQTLGGALSVGDAKSLGNDIINTVDPFHNYRGQYATQLNGLVNSPGYSNQFTPTALQNYQNPSSLASLGALNGYQSNSDLGASYATLNNSNAFNAPTFNALNGVGDQYKALLNDPSSILSDPIYQAQTAQGTDAVQRALAARGQTASGNELQALQDYGTANAAQYYNNRLGQLSTAYGQNLTAAQDQFGQQQNVALANLSRDQNSYNQAYNTNTANQSANQQGFNQANTAFSQGLQGNQAQFGQLGQLSGLSQANLGAAGRALSDIYSNVGSSYNQAGQGIAQTLSALGGVGGIANGLGSLGNSLGSWFNAGNTGTDLTNTVGDFSQYQTPDLFNTGYNYSNYDLLGNGSNLDYSNLFY